MRRTFTRILAAVVAGTAGTVLALGVPISASAAGTITAEWPVGVATGSIAVSPDGTRLYVATDSVGGGPAVHVLDTASGVSVAQYTGPQWTIDDVDLALNADGSILYASNRAANQLLAIDTTTGTVVDTVTTGAGPAGIAVAGDGRIFLVAQSAALLEIFWPSPLTRQYQRDLGAGTGPVDVAVSVDGAMAFTANSGNGTVTAVITVVDDAPVQLAVGGVPRSITMSRGGDLLAVSTGPGNTVVTIDEESYALAALPVDGAAAAVILPGSSVVYAGRGAEAFVDVFTSPSTQRVESIGPVGGAPRHLATSATGDRVYASSPDGTITVIATGHTDTLESDPAVPSKALIGTGVEPSIPLVVAVALVGFGILAAAAVLSRRRDRV